MKNRRGSTIFAIASALVPVLACGKSPPAGAADPTALAACDDYFDAIAGVACNDTTPPADELARVRTVFETICQNGLALAGNGATPA
ncbi:MAG: hypothetical protein ACRELB_16140 [Polyangiaceae bacterium]